ncbi:ABC-type transport system permease protein 1 (heme exporter protein B) [Haladaptatus paucihalophilus DX253]|uniref:Heme exporter protein B n=1 Tax=Haladaptatus paucihalophilus DX253 TaxID=797209 RepID=E7QXB2_HALPU|nr:MULTISPECIES: heme exporter protein CcmB [Haladaptatus]EFW90915.1 ABC-type transport system permease protein 1 (heme exporter protein B) [Haladaptatus paucihalophilus DX253]GKZ15573.1 cytochrome C biogenesis protein CcmB [Haladaptatus sp. T7]SHK26001.1 heme exporter protein B [Haladaptatus paucihalophilus DX253]
MRAFLRVAAEVVRKDLLVEARSKRVLNTAVVFSLLVVVVFAFGFAQTFVNLDTIGSGALWVSFVFAGTFGVIQSAVSEEQDAALDGLLLAPVDRSAIYVGKVVSSTAFVAGVELLTVGFVVVFLDYSPPVAAVPALVGIVVAASFGFSAAGVVLSLLTVKSQLRELLLPMLLVPLVIPVLLAGVSLTRGLTTGESLRSWVVLLLAYDGILFLAGFVTFEYVVEG